MFGLPCGQPDLCAAAANLCDADFSAVVGYYSDLPYAHTPQAAGAAKVAASKAMAAKSCEGWHTKGGSDPSDDAGILARQPVAWLKSTSSNGEPASLGTTVAPAAQPPAPTRHSPGGTARVDPGRDRPGECQLGGASDQHNPLLPELPLAPSLHQAGIQGLEPLQERGRACARPTRTAICRMTTGSSLRSPSCSSPKTSSVRRRAPWRDGPDGLEAAERFALQRFSASALHRWRAGLAAP